MARAKGWYANLEGERLVSMAQNMPTNLVVELGTAWGLSASYILAGTDARMVCVDIWPNEDVRHEFEVMLKENDWSGRVTVVHAPSLEVETWWSESIGLLHIDASHEYEDVLADYRAWSPHIAPGGWIAFHDSQTKGVGRVLREEVRTDKRWVNQGLVLSQWSAQRDG